MLLRCWEGMQSNCGRTDNNWPVLECQDLRRVYCVLGKIAVLSIYTVPEFAARCLSSKCAI